MRLFIGIRPDERTRERITHQVDSLRSFVPGRYVSPDNYHLTLAFLGQRDPEAIASLCQTLTDVAGESAPFELRLTGFDIFGRENSAIVYAACKASSALLGLATRLCDRLTAIGEIYDPKPLVPHITLIRKATISQGSLPRWPEPIPLSVSRLTLFHSTRVEDKLTYLPIWETPFPIDSKEVIPK